MVFFPRRHVPSAKGRPDAHLLVPARIAVVAPLLSAYPLALLNVWAARGVVLVGVGVLLWARPRPRKLPDPEDERGFTLVVGSLVLALAMLLTGTMLLAAVPAALFAVTIVYALVKGFVETHRKRRKQHEKQDRKARASAHFARAKAKKGISPD